MAYSTSAPPMLINQTVGGEHRHWIYRSTDAATVVRVTGYITNAQKLGMQVGDLVEVIDTDASPVARQLMNVVSINATTGAADLSDGVAVTATNSD
jgi:hypothetical protein